MNIISYAGLYCSHTALNRSQTVLKGRGPFLLILRRRYTNFSVEIWMHNLEMTKLDIWAI